MAALYALGALSQQEARAFERHLHEGCLACHAEVEQFDHVVGELGSAAMPVTPPGYLRDILVVRIEKEASETAPALGSVIPFPEIIAPVHRPTDPAPTSFSRVLLPWAAAAALLIALAYTFTAWRTERQSLRAAVDREKGRSSETQGDNKALKEQLAKRSVASAELAEINSVLSSPHSRIISLAGLGPASNASAKVYWDVQGNRWVVWADLPPAPEGKVYQLWCVTPQSKISAGLIAPDESGHGFTVVRFPSSVTKLAAAAITLEPEGGSAQPTMPIYALGKVL